MINFLQSFQNKLFEVVVTVLVTIGIVSAPAIPEEITQTTTKENKSIVSIEELVENPKETNPEKNKGLKLVTKEDNKETKKESAQKEPVVIEVKTKTIAMPNGSVVSIDETGNIVEYVKDISQKQTEDEELKTTQSNKESVEVTSVKVTPNTMSARIDWQTNRPTDSKVFILENGSSNVYNSESGFSTKHFVNIDNLKGGSSYSYEIEVIVDGEFYKKTGEFSTLNPPPPTFSIETFTIPTYQNHFFMRVKSDNGKFEFKALTLEIDNPYGNTSGNSQSTNIGSIQNQTNARTKGYMTCPGARNAYESWNKGIYPYPCPGSDDPEMDNPGYLTSMNPRANGDSVSIPIHPDIPYPNGTRIYYYKVIDTVTGEIFEYQK